MKVAAYQAPLLPAGSMEALGLIRDPVKWCETEGVDNAAAPPSSVMNARRFIRSPGRRGRAASGAE
jgi:5-aminopentanamidase